MGPGGATEPRGLRTVKNPSGLFLSGVLPEEGSPPPSSTPDICLPQTPRIHPDPRRLFFVPFPSYPTSRIPSPHAEATLRFHRPLRQPARFRRGAHRSPPDRARRRPQVAQPPAG